MISERIAKLEAAVESAEHLPTEKRAELLALLADLKEEVAPLQRSDEAAANRITDYAAASLQAAAAPEGTAAPAGALQGLADSVKGFEASHPQLVQIVDRISLVLSNMGI